jgi:LuxR family transcriptional regulator
VAQDIDDIIAQISEIAPEGFNFGFHVRFSRPALVKMTYRADWSRLYSERKYILCDPSVIWAMMNDGAARWSEIDLADPLGVMEAAATHGYNYGVAIGRGDIESKTIGSAARSDREFDDDEITAIQDAVSLVHEMLGQGPGLKPHHIAALQMVEEGLTYEESCERLNLSRTAFRARLAMVRRELSAKSNADAVRIAIEQGLLTSTSYTGVTKGLPSEG